MLMQGQFDSAKEFFNLNDIKDGLMQLARSGYHERALVGAKKFGFNDVAAIAELRAQDKD